MMGMVSRISFWTSLCLCGVHHFIRSILNGMLLVWIPMMLPNYFHTILEKLPKLKRCSTVSLACIEQQTHLETVGVLNKSTLSSFGNLFLRALHKQKDHLKGIFLWQVILLERFGCFFGLRSSQADAHVKFPLVVGIYIDLLGTLGLKWMAICIIWWIFWGGAILLSFCKFQLSPSKNGRQWSCLVSPYSSVVC